MFRYSVMRKHMYSVILLCIKHIINYDYQKCSLDHQMYQNYLRIYDITMIICCIILAKQEFL